MLIEKKEIENFLIVKPKVANFDASVSGSFKKQVLGWIKTGKYQVLIDLSEVHLIDSSGLRAIIVIYKALKRSDSVRLCGANRHIKNVLELTGMHNLFQFFSDETEGLQLVN